MFNLFKKILPKEERFFSLFEAHASCLTAGLQTLRKLLESDPEAASHVRWNIAQGIVAA